MLRHFSRDVFQIFNLRNIFETFGQIVPESAQKVISWQKNHIFLLLWSNFQKYCLFQKLEKKCSYGCVLTCYSSNFSIFN